MSKKTHRWKSRDNLSKPKHRNRDNLKAQSTENCSINLHFEKSSYFNDVTRPFQFIFNLSGKKAKSSENNFVKNNVLSRPFKKIETFDTITSGSSRNIDLFSDKNYLLKYQKLHVNEYIEFQSVLQLHSKLLNKLRCIILTTDSQHFEEITQYLEEFKNTMKLKEWASFKLIVIGEGFDIHKGVLKQHTVTRPPSRVEIGQYLPIEKEKEMLLNSLTPSSENDFGNNHEADDNTGNDFADEDEDNDYNDDDDGEDEDDDEAGRLLDVAAAGKFRDSRIIRSNQQVHKLADAKASPANVAHHIIQIAKSYENSIGVAKHTLGEIKDELEEVVELIDSFETDS